MRLTGQMIVKNEDRFVGFALEAVLPYVEKMLVYDTGSVDRTVEIIKSIKSDKIIFEEKGEVTPEQLVDLRLEQLERTRTPYFLLVDGDEIWPKQSIERLLSKAGQLPEEKLAIVCRTRNVVGDVWHYLPEETGGYQILGMKGNFNTRLYRKVPGLSVTGIYPLEAYTYQGKSLYEQDEKLEFIDVWYLHATHLQRSDSAPNPKYRYDLGIKMGREDMPEILNGEVLGKRSWIYELVAGILNPLKYIKRTVWQ